MSKSTGHAWRFFRAGGFDQVKLETGADLAHIGDLDQKLWVALACPTKGLEIDQRMIDLIDTDEDGRIRAPELIAATQFACRLLKDPDDLLKGADALPLASIDDSTPEGKTIVSAARRFLERAGKPDGTSISAADIAEPGTVFAGTPFNGDGVVTELSAPDDATRALIKDVVATMGGVPDRAGVPGVKQDAIDAFFAEVEAHGAWMAKATAAGSDAASVLPLGLDATAAAAAAVGAIRAKVDDYFGRCRLAAFDARALGALNRKEEEFLAIAAQDLTITADEVAGFPLAQVAPGKALPLSGAVNPAHAAALAALRDAAVRPLLGERAALTEADWAALSGKLAAYEAWTAEKPALKIAALPAARIAEIGQAAPRAALAELVAKDLALEAEAQSLENVERLVRYHQSLALLCTNFVNFKDFYDRSDPAIFQAGTLYLDQRSCTLCLPVDDAGRHALMAGLAGAYLAYCDCVRPATGEKRQIVAAFTGGDSDNLMVGRNGLFYDRKGQDWDATITKIIDNPISIRAAFWSPYKKFVRFIEEQVAKRAAAGEAESHSMLEQTAQTTVHIDKAKAPNEKKVDVGTVAALGVAVGAIGAFITGVIGYATGIFKLGPLATAAAVVGIICLISLPSVVLAYIKLRKRNLGPILDANGWAVNARAKINVPFGATLTGTPRLPPGSRRDTNDPYAEKGFPWKRLFVLVVLLWVVSSWYKGKLDRVLPENLRSRAVLGKWAPEPPEAPAKAGLKASNP